jgi:hypothetical protein
MENLKKNHLKLEFEESFPIGAEREKMVYNYLAKNNNVNSIIYNDNSDYDLFVSTNSKKFSIEVKFDNMCLKTGNFAIENTSRRHPSGINTTKSDIWCFVDSNNKMYFIKTKVLKELCVGKKQIQTRCEDSYNTVYLVKMVDFNKLSLDIERFLNE